VTNHVPVCAAGFLLEKEIKNFEKAMDDPTRPLAAVIGGAKVSDKLEVLETLLKEVDKLIIGGAMANTFLKSIGFSVGESKVEMDLADEAKNIVDKAREKGVRLYLPVDAVVAKDLKENAQTKKVTVYDVPENWQILDIGPASVLFFSEALDDARTIVWNGPMGVFEMDAFSRGTIAMAHTLANSHALTIVGGGDSSAAVDKAGMSDRMSYISTGGGAFLRMLERKPLPGVTALEKD
jgi:phosphoglycerate kinase